MIQQLFLEIQNNDIHATKALLEAGVDANEINVQSLSRRPLHAAVIAVGKGGDPEIIRSLKKHDADLNLTCPGIGGGTPLQVAVYNEFIEVTRLLLELGADPNIQGEEGDGPLRASVATENVTIAKLLLANGAAKTIDCFGGLEGSTALGMAVSRLNVELVNLLINAGAKLDIVDLDYQTALDYLPPSSSLNAVPREEIRRIFKNNSR